MVKADACARWRAVHLACEDVHCLDAFSKRVATVALRGSGIMVALR